MSEQPTQKFSFICSRGSIDGAYPALVLSLNSVRLGNDTTVFFTFFGLDVIKKGGAEQLKFYPQGPMGAVPGMPQLASSMMKKQVEEANIPDLPTMIEMCQLEGVKFVACKMTMDMMKMDEKDLIDDVEVWTAEQFLKHAPDCHINMFT